MGDEMSLEQFIENKWFKLLTRGAIVVVAAASSYIGVRLALYDQRIAKVETTINEVSQTQADRAAVNDDFQSTLTGTVDRLDTKVSALQLDTATVKGILEEMRRRDVAARFQIAP